MSIADAVTGALSRSVATVARAARRALDRLSPDATGADKPRGPRKSKGWRKHVRAIKARGATTRP